MSRYTPPRLSLRVKAVLALWLLFVAAASLFFLGDPVIPALFGTLLLASYGGWRLLRAVEAAADGLQRLAREREEG